MKIFITGATGYIGQKLTMRLLNLGHEVHALCRCWPEGDLFNNPKVTIYEGDLLNVQKISEGIAGCDQVYHAAAYARSWAKQRKTFFEVNVQGTVNVLDAALHAGVKKVVVTSTRGTFGASLSEPVNETTTSVPHFFTEYETSKFMAEERVNAYVRRGLPVVMVNPARVYGPGKLSESNALSCMIKAYVTGDWHIIPGNGKTIGSFTYIDNVVEGHILAMEKGTPGERYILGGINTDFNTFFQVLRKKSERRFLLVHLPVALMKVLAWKEELLATWFGMKPMITRKWIRKYSYNAACSSKKAITELGYSITPLDEGIERTLTWFKNDMHIYY
jgi:nucleoside-diphosphate-sugar epimerase